MHRLSVFILSATLFSLMLLTSACTREEVSLFADAFDRGFTRGMSAPRVTCSTYSTSYKGRSSSTTSCY